jgi:hypothetical protein
LEQVILAIPLVADEAAHGDLEKQLGAAVDFLKVAQHSFAMRELLDGETRVLQFHV